MYMNGLSWQPWERFAGERGYTSHAPSWPCHAGNPRHCAGTSTPRSACSPSRQVVDHYETVLATLPERPVLIGHSVGGLAVQKLVNEGYGAAGVVISPAPPRGILSLDPHFFRANFPHLNPLAGNRPIAMTPDRFHYAFANTLSRAGQRRPVPAVLGAGEPERSPFDPDPSGGRSISAWPHVPLLFAGGDEDHLTPLSMVRRNALAYRRSHGRLHLTEFTGQVARDLQRARLEGPSPSTPSTGSAPSSAPRPHAARLRAVPRLPAETAEIAPLRPVMRRSRMKAQQGRRVSRPATGGEAGRRSMAGEQLARRPAWTRAGRALAAV